MIELQDLITWSEKAKAANFNAIEQTSLLVICSYIMFKQEAETELGRALTDEEALQYYFDQTKADKAADTQEP